MHRRTFLNLLAAACVVPATILRLPGPVKATDYSAHLLIGVSEWGRAGSQPSIRVLNVTLTNLRTDRVAVDAVAIDPQERHENADNGDVLVQRRIHKAIYNFLQTDYGNVFWPNLEKRGPFNPDTWNYIAI